MTRHLPRVMLAFMFSTIIALGFAVKGRQAGFTFSPNSFSGTTFERG